MCFALPPPNSGARPRAEFILGLIESRAPSARQLVARPVSPRLISSRLGLPSKRPARNRNRLASDNFALPLAVWRFGPNQASRAARARRAENLPKNLAPRRRGQCTWRAAACVLLACSGRGRWRPRLDAIMLIWPLALARPALASPPQCVPPASLRQLFRAERVAGRPRTGSPANRNTLHELARPGMSRPHHAGALITRH